MRLYETVKWRSEAFDSLPHGKLPAHFTRKPFEHLLLYTNLSTAAV